MKSHENVWQFMKNTLKSMKIYVKPMKIISKEQRKIINHNENNKKIEKN